MWRNKIKSCNVDNYNYKKIDRFLLMSGLSSYNPEGFIIYGSFIRSLWTKEKYNNINVAFCKSEYLERYQQEDQTDLPIPIAVSATIYKTPESLLKQIDFTVCQIVYYNDVFLHSKLFFQHVAQKLLLLNHINKVNPLITLLRTYKYHSRGYSLISYDLDYLLYKMRNINIQVSEEDIKFHSDGTIVI